MDMDLLYPVFEINTEYGNNVFRTEDEDKFNAECEKYGLCKENDFMTTDEDDVNLYAEVTFRFPTVSFNEYLRNENE